MPTRRLPIGAEPHGDGTHFRVWAPRARTLNVQGATGGATSLKPEGNGYFSGVAPLGPGACYRYRLDDEQSYPDPGSRFQPEGPHGPSMVVDPEAFRWTDGQWRGVARPGQVIYEMHVGTFTREGTWQAAARELPELARLGITIVEMMPVAEFAGRFGWGYDGVALFAPTRLYGGPDDLRHFVDRAHAVGIGVLLDVVYNHLGPDGNYLAAFAPEYFTDRYANEWGQAVNFDGRDAEPVREFFTANAAYWIDEFHMDGLRLDATQQMFDASPRHVLVDIVRHARAAARGRSILLVAENEPQDARLARITLPASPSPAARKHTTRITAGARRSWSRPSSTGSSIRGSTTRGSASGAGPWPATCRTPPSSSTSRTTTRSRTPRAASGCTPSRVRDDGAP
jgi:maltooligosyltrehalose trehalohydrolase